MSPLYPVPQNDTNSINMDMSGVYLHDSAGDEPSLIPGNHSVQFMGLAPGMVGIYQINFVMPYVRSGTVSIGLLRQTCAPSIYDMCQAPGAIKTALGSTVSIPVQ
jgi:hypothetical protein